MAATVVPWSKFSRAKPFAWRWRCHRRKGSSMLCSASWPWPQGLPSKVKGFLLWISDRLLKQFIFTFYSSRSIFCKNDVTCTFFSLTPSIFGSQIRSERSESPLRAGEGQFGLTVGLFCILWSCCGVWREFGRKVVWSQKLLVEESNA